MTTVTLRDLTEEDRERLHVWRNSPEVAAYMYTDHHISRAANQHVRLVGGRVDSQVTNQVLSQLHSHLVNQLVSLVISLLVSHLADHQ